MSEFSSVSEQTFVSSSQTGFLQQILTNQEQILKNQSVLLRAERNRRIWGIVKIVVIGVLIIVPLLFLPVIMSSMMGGVDSALAGELSVGSVNSSFWENLNWLKQLMEGSAI